MIDDATAPSDAPPPMAVLPPLTPPAAPVLPPAAPVPHLARGWLVGALVVGALAVASLVSAWHTQQRVRALEQLLAKRQQTSDESATEARLLAKQALDSVREANGKLGVLEERVAESQLQRSQVEELVQSFSRSRDENLVADLEAALRVAMQQAALTGSTEPIATVLKQADDRLARVDNPRLERVRRAVARDLDRVRSSAVVDVPSLTIRLDEAVRQVDDLPLVATPERVTAAGRAAAAAPARGPRGGGAASAPVPAASSPSWVAALEHGWREFSGPFVEQLHQAVRVTSIEHPEAMLVTPEQSFFLRENVKLRLLNARLSLLSRQYELAQADLQLAQAAIDRYFDRGSRRVVALSDSLRQVAAQAHQASFPRPDDTLAALAAVAAGR